MTEVLVWFHDTIGLSWSWSIVALTVVVRILLVPVALRQIHSMQSLQMHAPEMKRIQQQFKNDRQRQSEELMKFYRDNKINPYAACLPIVFQIPIFISLFFVLRGFEKEIFCDPQYGSADFCHTVEGKLTVLPQFESMLEWLGLVHITEPVRDGWGPVLLLVYVASQLTSTWLMSTQMQSTAQRVMIMVLPIVFIPFIINFPTGLMIYWLTTNLWTTGQGIVTRRLMPKPTAPPKRTSRTPPREAQAEAAAAGAQGGSGGSQRTGPPRRVKRKRGGRPKR
jgi:YidC/Oxa1 family membrane protein insertase